MFLPVLNNFFPVMRWKINSSCRMEERKIVTYLMKNTAPEWVQSTLEWPHQMSLEVPEAVKQWQQQRHRIHSDP